MNPFKTISILNECPGSLSLLHLKMWELLKISPHCVVQFSVMPRFAGSGLVRNQIENNFLCFSILRLASGSRYSAFVRRKYVMSFPFYPAL